MEGIDRRPDGCLALLLSTVAITLASVFCFASLALGLDGLCMARLRSGLPVYPNARVIVENHSFLNTFGLGESSMVLNSPDDVETVRRWYYETVYGDLSQNRAAIRSRWAGQFRVYKATLDDSTTIVLTGACP